MTPFWENKTAELFPLSRGPLADWPSALQRCPPFPDALSLPQPQQHWGQALMGWHLLYACPRPHWGNKAVSVCCSGGLCVPFITVRPQKHTERRGSRGRAAVQSVLLWALRPGAPRGEYPTLDPYISISAFRAPTAFVSAHSGCQDMCLRC